MPSPMTMIGLGKRGSLHRIILRRERLAAQGCRHWFRNHSTLMRGKEISKYSRGVDAVSSVLAVIAWP